MSDKVEVLKVFRRGDGSIENVGGCYSVERKDAQELVASGEYIFCGESGGLMRAEQAEVFDVEEDVEGEDDGRD